MGIIRWACIISLLLFLISCKKERGNKVGDSDFQPIDRGTVDVKDLYLVFQENGSNIKDTFKYKTSQLADTIYLRKNSTYNAQVYFLDQSGKEVSSVIREKGEDYIVCYSPSKPTSLKLDQVSKDINGDDLGVSTKWTAAELTNTNERNTLNVTLNYQALPKDNFCSPGVRLIDANFIYKIK